MVPRGLRSFDTADADFFLRLLPGPRDRQGLPDSLGFWKAWMEDEHADASRSVGLLFGPSGCGKSSLLRAGLLPRLPARLRVVQIEAAPEATERRLLAGLCRTFPELDASAGLSRTIASLRHGNDLGADQKVILVIDQFEQWLNARRGDISAEPLVDALRQCDGRRVQAILVVRDDFWLPVSRFLDALEVPLREGHNAGRIDRFAPSHARHVLMLFGRAYGPSCHANAGAGAVPGRGAGGALSRRAGDSRSAQPVRGDVQIASVDSG